MSHKNFKTLKPKSIYEGLEFEEQPYATTHEFNIYIPIEKDRIGQFIEKDKSMSKSKSALFNFKSFQNEQRGKEGGNENQSKVREKLEKDIETANRITEEIEEKEQMDENKKLQSKVEVKSCLKGKKPQLPNVRTSREYLQNHGNKEMKDLRESLYFDERTKTIPKSTIKNRIIEDIVQDGDVFMKKDDLMGSIQQLKQLKLLKNREMNISKFPGVGKLSFVFNDQHSKATNAGYIRNNSGGFYTR